ncbi:putative F-box protein At5g55150 [Magnolia sinica]|uniref:putative F-box protein At5g55150 n=1 Tax=Magnolia sinica TaxID=86752 RepID=UPI00265AD10A|nr:putative F-box protein At5g55150 [Magnolia sinica]
MSNKRRKHGATSWANLPEDILGLILNHLPYIDHIHVGAVCVSWHSTVEKKVYCPARQLPWLMLFGNLESESCSFYSLSDNKVRTLNLPEFHGMRCIGSSDGWLVTLNESGDISLWNPFSRAKIQLPSLKQFPSLLNWRQRSYQFVVPMVRDEGRVAENEWVAPPPKFQYLVERVPFPKDACAEYKQKNVCISLIRKVVVSTQPGDFAVMIIHGQEEFAFCRLGDKSWTALAPRCRKVHQDIIFDKGRFYVVSFLGFVIAWDVFGTSPTATEIRLRMPPAQYERKYLAELAGDLLLVVRYYEKSRDVCDAYGKWITKTTGFEVFKLDQSGSMWTQLTSLGDHALFMGGSQSISCSARNFSDCKANCIYFCDDAWDVCFEESPPWGHDLGIFNLKDGSFDRYYGIESWVTIPQSIWFTPKPC